MKYCFLLMITFLAFGLCAYAKGIAGTISGPTSVCTSSTGLTYTVSGSSATTGYSWSVSGGTITSGQGTQTITVTFTSAGLGQNVTVSGNGLSAQITVSVYAPITNPGTITGPSAICPGAQGVAYSVSGVSTTTFSWGMPSGATIASGSGTNSITVNFSSTYAGGSIVVAGVNGACGAGPYTGKGVSGNVTTPDTPGAISGATSALQGQNGVSYSVPAVSNASGYIWSLPAGASIASGSNTNSITVNFSGSFTGGAIQVRGTNGSGTCLGPLSAALNITLASLPAAAGTISGNTSLCVTSSGNSYTFSVPAIANATFYTWSFPAHAYPTTNSSLNSVTVFFPTEVANTSTISVAGSNSFGNGTSSSLALNIYRPVGSLGSVSGSSVICPNASSVAYSVTASANATSYVWQLPTGASFASGANASSNSITVNFGSNFTSGNVSVYAEAGGCGRGSNSDFAVTVKASPSISGTISGSNLVCPGQSSVNYSIASVSEATSYIWTVPYGASIVSGQNTNSINVNYLSSNSGSITVYASNCAGNSSIVSLPVSFKPLPANAGLISGRSQICPGESGVIYSIDPIYGASGYSWTVPSGATIVAGQNSTSIQVDYSTSAASGSISVQGNNCSVAGESSQLAIDLASKVAAANFQHTVDNVTGTLLTYLPLFNITDGDINIPLNLSYSAVGVRVTSDEGWLSHNWNLSTQSYGVFREMRGLPDDYNGTSPDNRRGWLNGTMRAAIKTFTPATDNDPATCSDEAANYTFLDGISYDQDTEPDAYHVSIPGLSFDFYFDENKVPQVVPYKEVIITPNTTTGPITSFTVKDPNGIEYLFSDAETITEKMYEINQYYFVRKTNQHFTQFSYNTAWRLTKISSPVYGEINLTYDVLNINDDNLRPSYSNSRYMNLYKYNYPVITSNAYGAGGTIAYQRSSTEKLLHWIITPSQQVEFLSTDKYQGSLTKRLNSIRIFEKREGAITLTNEINFGYDLRGEVQRTFLTSLSFKASCTEAKYSFSYNGYTLPPYDSEDKDEWEFYKIKNASSSDLQYDETASAGSLERIDYPLKGFTAFFYETNNYWDGNTNVQGGGIRINKIIEYDGVSSQHDRVQEFDYKSIDGNSSGRLYHKAALSFSVARQPYLDVNNNAPRYREIQVAYPSLNTNEYFTVTGDQDLSTPNLVNGNPVAYERVSVKTRDAGKKVYEYKLVTPYGAISANNGEWIPSKVLIARPATGNSFCYETPNIQEGFNRYPFPVNPNYSFANIELTKVSDFNEAGILVKDIAYSYKRVFRDAAINTIYGLALEELPTYYYNGTSYVDAKMFLYSKYSLYTAVKTEQGTVIETIYHTADQQEKSQSMTEYFYTSAGHRELSKTITLNSDHSETIEEFKYTKDYSLTTATGTAATAIKDLQTANRVLLVESIKSKKRNGVTTPISANLTLYKTISGKVYPDKQYSFVSSDGNSAFTSSSVLNNSFSYDQTRYSLDQTFLSFDNFGNATEVVSRNRSVSSVAYGYNGTLPIISITNARLSEVRFSNFETTTNVDFFVSWPSTYSTGRSGTKALNMPAGNGSSYLIVNSFTNRKAPVYILSGWIKTASAGTLSVRVEAGTSETIPVSLSASTGWKYYSVRVPVESIVGTSSDFVLKIGSSVDIQIDDLAFHPEQAEFTAYSYQLPYGKSSEISSNGNTLFYDYDSWGRPTVVYDRDRNIIKTYKYHVKQ